VKHEGQQTDAYYFCVGGSVGKHAGVARPVGFRTPAHLVPEALERLLRKYLAERDGGENLRAWFGRNTDAELRAALAGEEFIPVERDLPSGRVPVELAG
jgi:sulfite reductase (ferredoxin)